MARNRNRILVREAQNVLDKMKYEIANELGIDYNGDCGALSSRENGMIGGMMVKRMIQYAEQNMTSKM